MSKNIHFVLLGATFTGVGIVYFLFRKKKQYDGEKVQTILLNNTESTSGSTSGGKKTIKKARLYRKKTKKRKTQY